MKIVILILNELPGSRVKLAKPEYIREAKRRVHIPASQPAKLKFDWVNTGQQTSLPNSVRLNPASQPAVLNS